MKEFMGWIGMTMSSGSIVLGEMRDKTESFCSRFFFVSHRYQFCLRIRSRIAEIGKLQMDSTMLN